MDGDDCCVIECCFFVVGVFLISFIVFDLDLLLFQLDLLDLEQDDISMMEFLVCFEQVWVVCDCFDFQIEIWCGCIFCVVWDKEKCGGEVWGVGFLQWLWEWEISKICVYGLI